MDKSIQTEMLNFWKGSTPVLAIFSDIESVR